MLQQTQVVTVIPYYERFLQRFPTLPDLAQASLDEVLKLWAGLGYYSRARNLHRAAVEIATQHGGQLPTTYAELRKLPGFGEYTAGAVASIAFGEAVPAIDGNVKRVLARLFALEGDITRQPTKRQLAEKATQLVQTATQLGAPAGEWTQTLIELGALVCLPHKPQCLLCPVNEMCQARLRGLQYELPVKPTKKPLPHYDVAAAVIYRQTETGAVEYLIAQRPLEGMLGGLWEFPGGKQEAGETLPDCLRREIREELGVDIAVGEMLTVVKHSYTHFKITLHAFYAQLTHEQTPQSLGVADWRWVTLPEMNEFAFPRTDSQIIEALGVEN